MVLGTVLALFLPSGELLLYSHTFVGSHWSSISHFRLNSESPFHIDHPFCHRNQPVPSRVWDRFPPSQPLLHSLKKNSNREVIHQSWSTQSTHYKKFQTWAKPQQLIPGFIAWGERQCAATTSGGVQDHYSFNTHSPSLPSHLTFCQDSKPV